MASNTRCLCCLLFSIITIVIFYPTWLTSPQSLNLDSMKEKSETVWEKLRLLKEVLDVGSNVEIAEEQNAEELVYCDENTDDFPNEEKVFSNRNLFDQLTRQLEEEVLSIMTSTSPCSTPASPPTTPPGLSPASRKTLGGSNNLLVGGKGRQRSVCQADACQARQRPAATSYDTRPLVYNRLVHVGN